MRKTPSPFPSCFVSPCISQPISLPSVRRSLYPTSPMAHVSPSFIQVSLRIDVFVRLVLNSVPVLLPSLVPSPATRKFRRTISRRGKVRFIFYYISCLCRTCSETSTIRLFAFLSWGYVKFILQVRCFRYRYDIGERKVLHLSHNISFV